MIKRNFGGIKTYYYIVFASIVFLFILLGSFLDLKIDRAIYSPDNFYANFFEYTGTLPASAIIASSGVFLYYYFNNKDKSKKIFEYLKYGSFIFLTLGIGVLWGLDAFSSHLESKIPCIIIGIIVISCTNGFFMYYLKDGENQDEYLKKGLLLIICGAISFALTFIIKGIIVRPRYMGIRMYLGNNEDYFRPWYLFSTSKDEVLNNMISNYGSYYIDSFPSGHASFSALIFLSLVFYNVKGNKEKRQLKLFIFSLISMLIIGLSRLTDGHHYLSDLGFGYLIGLLPLSLGFFITYRKENVKDNK